MFTMRSVDEIKIAVRGAYDLQKVRMQIGLRLCANFRSRLGLAPSTKDGAAADAEAQNVLDELRKSHKGLVQGVSRNRQLPAEDGFKGDGVISSYTELVLVHQFVSIEAHEASQFRQLNSLLEKVPIYTSYLQHVVGVGPAMAAVIIASLDPHKAHHVSGFWKYAGLDVAPDGRGRSRKEGHLVDREYINKKGETDVRKSVTYNPFLKTKLMGVLAGSFLRASSPQRKSYDDYRHRLETDPARVKVTSAKWIKLNKAGEDVSKLWTPGRIHQAAQRYMIKMFLAELWVKWRELEGLPVTLTYNETRRGYKHGDDRAA
jgi:hypothetical protein